MQENMDFESVDTYFNILSDITDRVAMMNSRYDSDLDQAFTDMEKQIREAMEWDPAEMKSDVLQAYLSHMSFHREIVAEIISGARHLLINERRHYLKRLVTYHKEFSRWFNRIEKKFAA